MLEMSLQVVLVVLLLVAIGWSGLLHRRLSMLRQGGDGIAKFVGDLVGATARAEAAIRQMREASQELARQWQRQRAEGDAAAAELRRLTAEAEAIAREMQRTASIQAAQLMAEPSTSTGRPRMDPVGAFGLAAPSVPDQSPHDRIRHAVRDLR
jgi:Domain of unknown function (DUF6468)